MEAATAAARGWAAERADDPGRSPRPRAARAPCALCGREARGFGYVHQLLWGRYPHHRFCSMRCLDCGSGHAARNNGMIDKTDMEMRAIKARPPAPRRGADRARADGAVLRPQRRRDRPHHRGLRRRVPGGHAAPGAASAIRFDDADSILRSTPMIDLNHGSGPICPRPASGGNVRRRINATIDARAGRRATASQQPRDYLGGSRIGEPCARKLVYEVTHTAEGPRRRLRGPDPAGLRRRPAFEALSIRWLRERRLRPARPARRRRAVRLRDRRRPASRPHRRRDRRRTRRSASPGRRCWSTRR